jgi:hypothetical protein
MDALYLIRGIAPPTGARPWTKGEALQFLNQLPSLSFPPAEEQLRARLFSELSRPLKTDLGMGMRGSLGLDINVEAYAHSNGEDFFTDQDWLYGYEERKPLLLVPAEFSLDNLFYFTTELQYSRGRYSKNDIYNTTKVSQIQIGAWSFILRHWYDIELPLSVWSEAYSQDFQTNVLLDLSQFDSEWPKRALAVVGGERLIFTIGRDRVQWGNGHTGNFVFDSHLDYQDFFRLSAASGRFRYEWLNVLYPPAGNWKSNPPVGGIYNTQNTPFRVLMGHRFEFLLRPNLVFAFSENVMYQDTGTMLSVFNPAFIYHNNWDRQKFNAIAQFELDWTFLPGYNFYAQAAIDQATAPGETLGEAPAFGLLAGFEHAQVAGPGFFTLSLEGAYTAPMLYRREIVDFILLRKSTSIGKWAYVDYTGYPYGGDALVAQLDADYFLLNGADFSLRLFAMLHGKMNPFISHSTTGDNMRSSDIHGWAPLGNPDEWETTLSASLRGSMPLPTFNPRVGFSIWVNADFIFKHNKIHLSPTAAGEAIIIHTPGWTRDLQLTAGVGLSL